LTPPASSSDQIVIRACETLDELQACVQVQREVWNFTDLELVPLRLFVVARKIGGQVIGAFAGPDLVGFALSFPGRRNEHVYLHSHMLAVRPDCRNAGIGRRIKLFQRQDALAQGIELIEWTFDPLEIKNAWLNVERLGAISRRYVNNQYGITSSPLQGGLPSDRFVAEWWLCSQRVEATLRDGRRPPAPVELRLSVPAQIYEWKANPEMRSRAAEVQTRNREALTQAFAGGMALLGYERDADGNGVLLLGRWDEPWE
jgi:predicted GNAT superfamily acetyltransferase